MSVNEYCVTRDSYVSTEMQGHLEKKGVLGNKSKLWCSVQQSTLVMQKKPGSASKTIDLKVCHHVRKVTSDVTGTHFEIFEKKNTHVFVCPTSENCTAWVKSLQVAMALKDSGEFSQDHAANTKDDDGTDDVFYYSLSPQVKGTEETTIINEYSEACDIRKTSTQSCMENEYWEVGDVENKLDKSQPTAQLINRSTNSSSTQNDADNIYSDAESEAVKTNKSFTDSNSVPREVKATPPPTPQRASSTARITISTSKKDESNNNVCPETFKDVQSTNTDDNTRDLQSNDDFDNDDKDVDNNDDDSLFQTLQDALSVSSSPVPDFIHPLTDDDWQPVNDLTNFLSTNKEFCRVSVSLEQVHGDPVNSLKSYLETAGIASRKLGHS